MINKTSSARAFLLVGLMIAISLACSLPLPASAPAISVATSYSQPSAPPDIPTEVPPAGPAAPGLPPTPTKLPLPPLPDFNQVLTFGGGGGGMPCDYPVTPNLISVPNIAFGHVVQLCLTLSGLNLGNPFKIKLTGPDGQSLLSPGLLLDREKKVIRWTGYPGYESPAEWTSDGTLFATLFVSWPALLQPGNWHITAFGDGFTANGDFQVSIGDGKRYVTALDPRAGSEILPAEEDTSRHPIKPNSSGGVDVIGKYFPANTPVFILLYLVTSPDEASLVEKQSVPSDNSGTVRARLSGPFRGGQSYLLIGLTDPQTLLNGEVLNSSPSFPSDYFQLAP
jgi:hypothetical protein